MANNINNYPDANAIGANDDLLMSKGGSQLQMINYNKLAKAIIEEYASSSVAGANQTLKAALDSLNSKLALWTDKSTSQKISDCNAITESGITVVGPQTLNIPAGLGNLHSVMLSIRSTSTNYVNQFLFPNQTGSTIYYRRKQGDTGWHTWQCFHPTDQ